MNLTEIRYWKYDSPIPANPSLRVFRAWLDEQIAMIPAESLDAARIELDTNSTNRECWPTLSISYQRPETEKEVEVRIAKEAAGELANERAERLELVRLAAKYPG